MRAARWPGTPLALAVGAPLAAAAIGGVLAPMLAARVGGISLGAEAPAEGILLRSALAGAMALSAFAGGVLVARRPRLAAALLALPIPLPRLRAGANPHPVVPAPAAVLLAAALAAPWSPRRG